MMDLADAPTHVIKTVLDFDKRAKVAAAQAERLQAEREQARETLNKRSFTLEDREINHTSFESACARYGAALRLADKLSRAHERCEEWIATLPPDAVLEEVEVDAAEEDLGLEAVKRRTKGLAESIAAIRNAPVIRDDVDHRVRDWVAAHAIAPPRSGTWTSRPKCFLGCELRCRPRGNA
jgi:hypothetical protein